MKKQYETPKVAWFERGGNCRAKPCHTHCGGPQVGKGLRTKKSPQKVK